jgi:hypothetical protein
VLPLRDRAASITRTLTQVLENDSTIRVLAINAEARPRLNDTDRFEGIGHMVYGSLMQGDDGTLVLSWRLVVVENGVIINAENVFIAHGSESDSLAAVGQRIAACLRSTSVDST